MNENILNKLNKLPYGTVIKLTWHRDYTKHNDGVYITRFNSHQPMFDLFSFGHPYDVKTKSCPCGEAGFQSENIINIEPVDLNEFSDWVGECISFQKSVIEEKGIDICKETGPLYILMKSDNDNEEFVWNLFERKIHTMINS